ncbi:FAD binding domain-containing protein [Streptomyces sp. NPDC088732]|uniref:FAD binding domain-containing protein n=1 Tax=Streptomyces sp. NPDC088732 TaxID=3365879 RepID=UPI003817B227
MLLHLPTTVSEAQECMARDAVPIGGATLVWAGWQRDGFPEHAMSLRELPEANGIEREALGAAVVLHRIDDRVPEALRRAAASVGTGAVRRTATVGGNLVGSALRCLLPAALVLDARAVTLETDGVYETDLSDALAKHHLLLGIRWREPIASGYRKQPAEAGGPPPLVVAAAVHADPAGGSRLRVAVRDGYDVLSATVPCDAGAEQALHALESTGIGTLPAAARDLVSEQVSGIVTGPAGS